MKAPANPKRSRRSTGAVTLRDVAAMAGVAPITASRVVNTPDQVSADVRQRVQDAIARTGYVPNRMAGGLASARSKLIAAVVPSTVMSVFMQTLESLNDTLFDAGYQLMLGHTGYSPERQAQLLEAIVGRRPDGIFLTGILPPGPSRTRLLASGIPVVETWDLTPTPIDMLIGFSHADIGREVARFLLSKGRRRLASIKADDERAARRHQTFADTVAAAKGRKVVSIDVGGSRSLRSGRDALAQLLAQDPKVDAIFCSSDLLAQGVITEAQARGLRIPQDLAVIGFGDVPFAADLVPALSTVRINGVELGVLAARCLIARAEGLAVEPRIVDVGFSVVERDTT